MAILKDIKLFLDQKKLNSNRLLFECLFWGISISQKEEAAVELLREKSYLKKVSEYVYTNSESFSNEDSYFQRQITERYIKTAELFSKIFEVDFNVYIYNNESLKARNKELSQISNDNSPILKFESLRLNKPDATSNPIDDICTRVAKERFLIRPSYQRKEVIDRNKSSAIIESIILGVKLPPIFIYKRDDGVAEVLDGQQRLLSILGFLDKEFLDENKKLSSSKKNNFRLRKLNILKDLEGKNFNQLPSVLQNRILDFDLWIIEINAKNNPDFDPIDLFIRLNYKPFPISENTFEMWNSYVDRDIIEKIKNIYKENEAWFYIRRDNRRMDNEGLITYLSFLEFNVDKNESWKDAPSILDIYRSSSKLNLRIQSKSEITQVLENSNHKSAFLDSCDVLQTNFILKVRELLNDFNGIEHLSEDQLRVELDKVLNVSNLRTYQSFYTLWLILLNIPYASIVKNKKELKNDITSLIQDMRSQKDVNTFKSEIKDLQMKYR